MSLDRRIRRLEQRQPAPREQLPAIVVVDQNGFIVDDSSPVIAPWVGKPRISLPPDTQTIRGVDPRRVLGIA